MENIQVFDIVVVSLVTLLGLKGLFRGFIKEVFALVGLVGGVFVASRFSTQMGNIINGVMPIDNNNTLTLVGFIASLILFWILIYFVGSVVSKIFSLSGLGIIDKLLGFIFGASKVFLLFSIITYAATQVKVIDKKITKNLGQSQVLPLLKSTGAYIIKLDTTQLNNGIKKHVNTAINKTKNTIKDISTQSIKQKVTELKDKITNKNNTTKE